MKLHACRHCGSRLRTYTELQEHLKTHPNVCVTCYRVFSNRSILLAHTCKVEEYLCEICQRSYSTQTKLARHKRETPCRHSLPSKADSTDRGLGSATTTTCRRIRLMTSDTVGLELGHIFTDRTTAFKLNISYGFILRNRTSGRYRYYHSSCNCCGRYLDEPSLITNADTFENFLERIKEPDILTWALSQRPNSDWVVEIVTNATIFVNRILQHPIGCVGIVLPPHVKYNHSVTGLEKDHHGRPYVDNVCLFRCMGLHLGHDPNTLYAKYTDQPVEIFEGVTIDELQKVETLFEMNFIVYKLSDTSAQLFDGLCASTPTLCTSIYMKRTTHLFTILRRIVIHINVASVNIVCGNILPDWNDTN